MLLNCLVLATFDVPSMEQLDQCISRTGYCDLRFKQQVQALFESKKDSLSIDMYKDFDFDRFLQLTALVVVHGDSFNSVFTPEVARDLLLPVLKSERVLLKRSLPTTVMDVYPKPKAHVPRRPETHYKANFQKMIKHLFIAVILLFPGTGLITSLSFYVPRSYDLKNFKKKTEKCHLVPVDGANGPCDVPLYETVTYTHTCISEGSNPCITPPDTTEIINHFETKTGAAKTQRAQESLDKKRCDLDSDVPGLTKADCTTTLATKRKNFENFDKYMIWIVIIFGIWSTLWYFIAPFVNALGPPSYK